MANQRVMTLEDPAGLLITTDLLEQIGVSAGDKVEIKITDRALIVRPLAEAGQEKAMELFLNINRASLQASDDEVENLILGIAAGRITRDEAERILSQRAVIAN